MNNLDDYKYVVEETEIKEVIDNTIHKKRVVSIGLLDKATRVIIPHPLTNFIRLRYEYQGVSINSMKAPAYIICRFLNFIIKRIVNKDSKFLTLVNQGIKGLTLMHGSEYLTHLTNSGLKRSTVFYYENYIKEFYMFLNEHSLLNEAISFKSFQDNKGKQVFLSPFKTTSLGTKYPKKTHINNKHLKLKDFGPNRNRLVTEFLEEAKYVAPEIALALCFQFFGGLRKGEIVNLTREDIYIKYRRTLSVQIKDNRSLLFSHLKDTSAESPKRLNYLEPHLAKQMILNSDLLWDYYDSHMKDLDIKVKNGFIKNPTLLFYNKNGQAMSGRVYDKRFKKVKKSLLNKLATTQGREEDYLFLKDSYWSTHIGRGVFTSYLLDLNLNVFQIAIARGDTSIESAKEYVDTKTSLHYINELQNELNNHTLLDKEKNAIEQTFYDNNIFTGVNSNVRKNRQF